MFGYGHSYQPICSLYTDRLVYLCHTTPDKSAPVMKYLCKEK